MGATSIHIKPCLGSSEKHNTREKELDYIKKELTKDNESFVLQSTKDCLADIKARYEKTTGQKMQAKATPIREGVVVIDQNTTMAQLKNFSNELEKRFGIKTIQIHTHKDEGHNTIDKEWKPNLHAHMVFNWTANDGKSLKLNKQDLSEIQTILAESIGMDRGKSSDVKHLNIIQYKIDMRKEELDLLNQKTKELQKEVSSLELKNTAGKAGKAILGSIERAFGDNKLQALQSDYDGYIVKANDYVRALMDKHSTELKVKDNELKGKDNVISALSKENEAIVQIFPTLVNARDNIAQLKSLRVDPYTMKNVLLGHTITYEGDIHDENKNHTHQVRDVKLKIGMSTQGENLVWCNDKMPRTLLSELWQKVMDLKQSFKKEITRKPDNSRDFGIT